MYETTSHPSRIYEQLREQLRHSLIDQGDAGDRLPSERKLAEDFGVSPVTISRALQELQNEGVIRRVPGKGTFILPGSKRAQRAASEALKSSSSQSFGAQSMTLPWEAISNGNFKPNVEMGRTPHALIIAQLSSDLPQKSHEYWGNRATSRLERCIQQNGGHTTVIDLSGCAETKILEKWNQILQSEVNSVVLIGDVATSLNELWGSLLLQRQFQQDTSPFAVVQMAWNSNIVWPFDAIGFSDAWGIHLVTQHLLEQGHRKIAFFSPAPDIIWAKERYSSFRRALLAMGISDAPVIYNEMTATAGCQGKFRESAARLLDECPECTAVVAANDAMAQVLMQVSREQGRNVPESLSVVGFDDWNMSVQMGLTTVHVPVEEMAEAATSLLTRRLNYPTVNSRIEMPVNPSLIVRSSTQAPV